MDVFGVPIEGASAEQVLGSLDQDSTPRWIVTANPEILLAAKRDPSYAAVLRQADLRVVDGFGLWLMLRLSGHRTERVTGVELAEQVAEFANAKHWRLALIGGATADVSMRAAEALKKKFPSLQVMSEHGGLVDAVGHDDASGEEARHRLTMLAPQVLLVALGHPKQERWIANYLPEFPGLKLVMGVGGTLDFWAGTVKRAPRAMRQLGLEWLWRLLVEPRRFGRIWNAVVVFPVAFIFSSLRGTK